VQIFFTVDGKVMVSELTGNLAEQVRIISIIYKTAEIKSFWDPSKMPIIQLVQGTAE
jgi:hypothetical protein